MIKALLFDADGVAIKKHRYFSEVYAEKNSIPLEKITPFFHGRFVLCKIGQADLKKEIEPYLTEWGWQGTVDDFLNDWFVSEGKPDESVLQAVKKYRESGIKCYLVSEQEKYRARYIDEVMKFKDYFDGTFYTCDIGKTKSEKEFYEIVLSRLNLKPEEVQYVDDDPENLQVAKSAGIETKLFTSARDLQ